MLVRRRYSVVDVNVSSVVDVNFSSVVDVDVSSIVDVDDSYSYVFFPLF
jgi:hypothetical protein